MSEFFLLCKVLDFQCRYLADDCCVKLAVILEQLITDLFRGTIPSPLCERNLKCVCVCAIEKVEIILPSPSCKRLEIVVTMRGAGQKCLNPGSRFTKKYILTSLLLSLPKKVLFILSSLSRNTQKAAV
uniref:Chemokine interleukin-8-like domain-containing protein n=1 Tax=Sinocyclocheilus rhinocerous TaxID=307959 RepID=A0A673FSY5_9TELE